MAGGSLLNVDAELAAVHAMLVAKEIKLQAPCRTGLPVLAGLDISGCARLDEVAIQVQQFV
jgi:hypothetical protein